VRHKSHKMKNTNNTCWVIGHRISPVQVSGDYDMVIGQTPANVPGPPPHYHSGYNEVFLVLEGEMEFVVEGEVRTVRAGESVDLPPDTIHTFSNKSDQGCKWVNIHSPKGFSAFFKAVGIPEAEEDAMVRSVDDAVIQKVMRVAAQYDMHIKLQA